MKTTRLALNMMAVFAACLFCSTLAQAQASRTWVSDSGNDANPCSKTQPCKSFNEAISKTAAGGKITCLDMGEFGALTITKSITIDCRRTRSDILAASTNGIVINALTTDKIILRGLDINGGGGVDGLDGIRFLAGGSLHVEDTTINNMTNGINVGLNQAAIAEVYVTNSYIRNNTSVGIFVSNATGTEVKGVVERATLENNAFGLIGRNGARFDVRNSVAAGNATTGILSEVTAGAGQSIVNVINCSVTSNGTGLGGGNQGTMRVSGTTISFNNTGVSAGTGTISTFADNILRDNAVPGAFTLPALTKN